MGLDQVDSILLFNIDLDLSDRSTYCFKLELLPL